MDTIESFRDVLSGLQDLYLSTLSNRMNEVMKVLTIMATIFIPLTFIAGIYGMNFEYMPELKWPWAYPALWILLVAIFLSMIFWFKRKKWL
jgi:magnesium transporter